jgi:hypothetical protein
LREGGRLRVPCDWICLKDACLGYLHFHIFRNQMFWLRSQLVCYQCIPEPSFGNNLVIREFAGDGSGREQCWKFWAFKL